MAKASFNAALKHVLVYEGGYSNHPKDPGGVTLEGVIQRVYDGYRKRKGLPAQILNASMRKTAAWKKERDAIYREQYWDAIRGDELPAGVDFVVFDGAVNSGPSQSVKWLQRALGIAADGNIGEASLAAVMARKDHDKLIADICSRRLAFLKQLKTWSTFGKGWGARVSNVLANGQALARGSEASHKTTAEEGNAKASSSDLSGPPVPVGVGTAGTTIGTVTTGTLDTLQTTSATLEPLSDGIQVVKYIVIGITLIIAAVTIYGVYRNYKTQRARNGEDSTAVPEEL